MWLAVGGGEIEGGRHGECSSTVSMAFKQERIAVG